MGFAKRSPLRRGVLLFAGLLHGFECLLGADIGPLIGGLVAEQDGEAGRERGGVGERARSSDWSRQARSTSHWWRAMFSTWNISVGVAGDHSSIKPCEELCEFGGVFARDKERARGETVTECEFWEEMALPASYGGQWMR